MYADACMTRQVRRCKYAGLLELTSFSSTNYCRAIRGSGAAITNGGGADAAPCTAVSTGPCQGPIP
jgi:hypothetical protein